MADVPVPVVPASTLQVLIDSINGILLKPSLHDLLAILKGFRNGLVYGAKVRFPHALVMVFLFRSGTIREKLKAVLKATRTHAKNLATFVTIYKTLMYGQRVFRGKESAGDSFFAGLVGGWAVFGRDGTNNVNQQIVIYVFARVVLALAKLSVEQKIIPDPENRTRNNAWPVFAALSWGAVMFLFRWHPESIQPSLRSSMQYLYVNSDRWTSWRNFLLYNV
ncbi:hypothetical protein RUND412_002099 [Rhizina undulata]